MVTHIGSKTNSLNKQVNIIIANATEADIIRLIVNKDKQLNVTNSLIISVPQDAENNDIPNSASIWFADNDGNIMELAKPIAAYNELSERITQLENAINN